MALSDGSVRGVFSRCVFRFHFHSQNVFWYVFSFTTPVGVVLCCCCLPVGCVGFVPRRHYVHIYMEFCVESYAHYSCEYPPTSDCDDRVSPYQSGCSLQSECIICRKPAHYKTHITSYSLFFVLNSFLVCLLSLPLLLTRCGSIEAVVLFLVCPLYLLFS